MKGRIFTMLFSLPFLGIGVWMAWSIGATLYLAAESRGWEPVAAQLESAGYRRSNSDDGDSYEAYASYRYEYRGVGYRNDRVALDSGSDSIGDFQRDLGNQLSGALARGGAITVWVDPDAPERSLIDRRIRWGLIGFKSIFLIVFGGVGALFFYAAWRRRNEPEADDPRFADTPWLLNSDWQGGPIRSSAKNTVWAAWGFALFWNLISAPLPFLLYEEIVEKKNYPAAIGILFTLVGIGLIFWAIRRTREWRRFGPTPVSLDPFPGSIGGHVGGSLELRVPYDGSTDFKLTLACIERYISGSGKDRQWRETAKWQDEALAYAEPGGPGTRLLFRFDVPPGLEESAARQEGDRYFTWRLTVEAELSGADFNRSFEIPVYATAQQSRSLPARALDATRERHHSAQDSAARDLVRIAQDGLAKTLFYPMGRHVGAGIVGTLIGGLFAGAGVWLFLRENERLFGSIFGVVGTLIALFGLYILLRSLEVRLEGDTLVSIRRVLGIPVRRRSMRRSEFHAFEKDTSLQTQSGGKHVMYYSIRGIDRHANEILLGEGFEGESGADAAIRMLQQELGLEPKRRDDSEFDNELVNEF